MLMAEIGGLTISPVLLEKTENEGFNKGKEALRLPQMKYYQASVGLN